MDAITYNDISTELANLIPPFPRGKTVTYRLLDHGDKLETVDSTGRVSDRRVETGNTLLKASTSIYDPYKEDDVMLAVTKGSVIRGTAGQQYREPVIEYIEFGPTGELTLTESQKPIYRHMELLPINKTSRLPGGEQRTNTFKFERIEPEKTEREAADRSRLVVRVQALINENSDAENKVIAQRLKRDVSKSTDGIFNDLMLLASADPQMVYNATTDEAVKAEALVADLKAAKLIEFVGEKQQWENTVSREILHVVTQGEPADSLVNYLVGSLGTKTKTALARLLEEKNKKGGKR
jgi:hypothetical protein